MATAARRVAYGVLRGVFEREDWADRAFAAAAEGAELDPRERAQSQSLAYGAVRMRGTIDAIVGRLCDRPLTKIDPQLLAALRLGAFELLYVDRTPARAAVSEAVSLAKASGARSGAALVNAVLRRLERERGAVEELLADTSTPEAASVALSYPGWLSELWFAELGRESAISLMRAMNEPAEVAFRVNGLKLSVEEACGRLAAAGQELAAEPPPPAPDCALVAAGRVVEATRTMVSAGELVPQSRGAQRAAELVRCEPGQRVLELCAAPGGKTTALAAQMEGVGEIVAVERDEGRASRLERSCARAGAGNVRVLRADAATADLGDGYDRVLLDPPCSDLGTLDSKPDARWRKTPELVERVSLLQRQLLLRAARALAPGGRLVYSVCTLTRAEGEQVVDSPHGLELESVEETRRDRNATSGFFIAVLGRSA